jgi:prepilin-type N-terminal cleavage/methylation domain-containing protein
MNLRSNRSGFSVVEILIVVVVLGLVGFIGYVFYTKQSNTTVNSTTNQSATAEDVPAAPGVTTTSDLEKASKMLDESDTASSSDSAELDSQLQSF